MFSTKHQLWDLWFYHNVDLGSGRCYTADDSSGDQLWEDKSSLLGPSFECLSTITHNAFMCVNTEAGGVWLRPGGRFHHVLMTRQICRVPQMEASKTSEISKFLLLIRFLKLLPRGRRGWGGRVGREGKNQESLKRFIKGIKNLKATPSVSIKGPVDEENPDMQLILTRTLLTRQLSMQKKKKKVCPKAIQSIAQLAAIIKRRSVLRSAPHQPAKLQLTLWMHRAHKDAAADSTGNYMLASLHSSSRSNIMRWPNHSAVSKLRHIQTTELSTQAERPVWKYVKPTREGILPRIHALTLGLWIWLDMKVNWTTLHSYKRSRKMWLIHKLLQNLISSYFKTGFQQQFYWIWIQYIM